MSHRIKSTQRENENIIMPDAKAPSWPSYQGTSHLVGTSPSGRVTVYVDPSLGKQAQQNAQDLLKDADRVVKANDGLFGTTGGPVSVILFALGGATDVPEAPTIMAAITPPATPSRWTFPMETQIESRPCLRPN